MKGVSLEKIRKDAKTYVMSGTGSAPFTITNPKTNVSVSSTGYVGKHWINFDSDGNSINSKSAHIGVSEDDLTELGYTIRNGNNEVSLYNHRVSAKDSTGVLKEYVIKEWFPDETLGLIVCILGDYGID